MEKRPLQLHLGQFEQIIEQALNCLIALNGLGWGDNLLSSFIYIAS